MYMRYSKYLVAYIPHLILGNLYAINPAIITLQ